MSQSHGVARIVDNLIAAINLGGVAEGLVLAAKAGLDPALFLQVARASSGASAALDAYGPLMLAREGAAADGSLDATRRAVEAALDLGRELAVPLPLSGVLHAALLALAHRGPGDQSAAALVTLQEELAAARLADVRPGAAPGLRPPAGADRPLRVGFIGLGRIGRPIAESIQRGGFAMVVHNRSQAVVEQLVAQGMERAASPAEVTRRSDVVCTCLPDDATVERIFTGPDGVLGAARPGQVLIDLGTTALGLTQRVGDEVTAKDAHFLDAPVSGGIPGAREGRLTIMIGATEDGFRLGSPVLAAAGNRLFHLGAPGNGQVAKQVNNLMHQNNVAALCEGFTLGAAAGLAADALLAAVQQSRGASYAVTNRGALLAKRDFAPRFTTYGRIKDGRAVIALAQFLHMPLPLTALSQELHEAAAAQGYGDEDWVSLAKVYERLAGIEA